MGGGNSSWKDRADCPLSPRAARGCHLWLHRALWWPARGIAAHSAVRPPRSGRRTAGTGRPRPCPGRSRTRARPELVSAAFPGPGPASQVPPRPGPALGLSNNGVAGSTFNETPCYLRSLLWRQNPGWGLSCWAGLAGPQGEVGGPCTPPGGRPSPCQGLQCGGWGRGSGLPASSGGTALSFSGPVLGPWRGGPAPLVLVTAGQVPGPATLLESVPLCPGRCGSSCP